MQALRVLLALAVAVGTAAATPGDDLAAARKAFRDGEYQSALEKYNALVRPEIKLADSNDIVEAYVNLGVCRVETGDDDGAKEEFERALGIDPNKQLDPVVITNKRAIRLFDDTKAELRTRAEREAEKRKAAELLETQRKALENLIVYKEQQYYFNWLPFGVGQFQNGDRKKGIFFLSTQVITGATSVAIFGYLVQKYGISSDKVPFDEGPDVRRYQQIEIAAGLAFFGLYALSVVDAHMNYVPQKRINPDDLPPDLRDVIKVTPKKKTSLKERLHISPMITPNGVGVGIGWEN